MYTSRLDPKCKRLWQCPKPFITWDDKTWYTPGNQRRGLGKNPLGEFMSTLSTQASLSMRYTNHSVRAMCISVLDSEGFEARDIMSVSSHKSEQTIKSYSKTSDGKKRKMSEALSNALVISPKVAKMQSVQNQQEVEINLNANNNNNTEDNIGAIRELLQLSPEQEKEFFNEIFTQEFEMPSPSKNSPTHTVSINSNSNSIQTNPNTTRCIPKMLFSNNNITINFNMK